MLHENGDAVFRDTGGNDETCQAGTFVTRQMPPTPEAPRGFGDIAFIPSDVLATTKNMSEEDRSAVHQVFAEKQWAKNDQNGWTEKEAEYHRQQMVEIEKIGSEIAAKAEEAAKAKATRKE